MKTARQIAITVTIFALVAWSLQIAAQVVVTSPVVSDTFLRGDANGDENVDFNDVMTSLNYLFRRGPTPTCLDAADANDDGRINVTDPIVTILFLFGGGPPLPAPMGSPGADPTPDDLECGPGI